MDPIEEIKMQATPISKWKKPKAIEVPSGNVCLVRKIGIQTFIAMGVIPNGLAPILLSQDEEKRNKAVGDLSGNPKRVREYMSMIDFITLKVVVEPKLSPAPDCRICGQPLSSPNHPIFVPDEFSEGQHLYEGDRDPNLFYVDEVDDDDKAFIFYSVVMGGTADVARFREEQRKRLELMVAKQDMALSTEPVTSNQ